MSSILRNKFTEQQRESNTTMKSKETLAEYIRDTSTYLWLISFTSIDSFYLFIFSFYVINAYW